MKPAGGGPPVIGPLVRRFGIIGFLGLGVAVLALVGYFVVMNYDTLLAGQSVNNIGDQQKGWMNIALMVFAAGAVVTVIGLFRARSVEMTPEVGGELAEAPMAAPMESAGLGDVEAPLAPAVGGTREPAVWTAPAAAPAAARAAPYEEPSRLPEPEPAVAAAPHVEEEPHEEEEEEVSLDIPTTARPPEVEASAPASAAAAAASAGASDELEDLFGELESEVQAAEEEEDVLYECPNCHGMVKEDDTSCPHCHVTFEG